MRIILALLLLSSVGEAAQLVLPTTCYVKKETFLVATTISVRVASTLADTNCYILQNKDGANSVFGSINASTQTNGFEVQSGSIFQFYIGNYNNLYLRSSSGSINVDLLSGTTTP